MNLFSENDVLIINQILFFNLKPPLIIMVYFLREVSVWKLRFYGRMMLTLTCGVILTQNSCWWPTEDKHTEPWLGRLVTSRWAENEERGTHDWLYKNNFCWKAECHATYAPTKRFNPWLLLLHVIHFSCLFLWTYLRTLLYDILKAWNEKSLYEATCFLF